MCVCVKTGDTKLSVGGLSTIKKNIDNKMQYSL